MKKAFCACKKFQELMCFTTAKHISVFNFFSLFDFYGHGFRVYFNESVDFGFFDHKFLLLSPSCETRGGRSKQVSPQFLVKERAVLERIVSILKGAARSDRFCTQMTSKYNQLSLRVEPLSLVKFPISVKFAQSLIQSARPSKFGRREETLYDPKVRDVWEIPASRIKIEKRTWNLTLKQVLEQIQQNLHLPEDGKLTAELHNMLIYEPGQFFTGHQDSEKMDGMVATLIVLLPSKFTGGTLVIDQHGDKKSFHAPRAADENLTFMAFYADCHHEVKKVTTGYRIALTYNLVFKPATKVLASQSNPILTKELKTYFSEPDRPSVSSFSLQPPQWMIYLLDHQYTQRSLTWQGLKGADRSRAAELLGAAKDLGLTAHLALADIHETWNAEGDDRSWRAYKRYRSYEDDEYDEDDESGSSKVEDYSLTELIEDDYELRYWVDSSGKPAKFGKHRVNREMVCWTKAVDEFKPFQSEYEGFMGNYGNTLDRWYHRAAIVLWRSDSEYASVFAVDSQVAFKKIGKILGKDLAAGQAALKQIMPQWSHRGSVNFPDISLVFEIASAAKSIDMASSLMVPLNLDVLSEETKVSFLKLIGIYGESWGLQQLKDWSQKQSGYRGSYVKDILSYVKSLHRNYKSLSSWMMEYQFSVLVNDDKKDESSASLRDLKRRQKERMNIVISLLKSAGAAEFPEIHSRIVFHILQHSRLYPALELAKLLQKN